MMTVDSSVWIDYLKGLPTPQTQQLDSLLLDPSVDLVLLDVVLMEILRGIRSDSEFEHTQTTLAALPVYTAGGEAAALSAAHIYRRLRQNDITVRSSIDLMVATWSLNNEAELLHNDRDFAQISRYFPITQPL